MKPFIEHITLGALTADAYCLGAHWIYDEEKLRTLDIDWNTLNDHQAQWHPQKRAGEFTHYGDQLVLLYEYVGQHDSFKLNRYMRDWYFYMRPYKGYMDAATRNTLDNMSARNPLPCGFGSEDLSVAGRIGPLLALSATREQFLENVDLFTRATHFTQVTRDCSAFCAHLLWDLQNEVAFQSAVDGAYANASPWMKQTIDGAKNALSLTPAVAIRQFGPDCNARSAMPGALYLLFRFGSDYKTAMMENAKAGGDSSARGMVAGMLMTAAHGKDIIPKEWVNGLKYRMNVQ